MLCNLLRGQNAGGEMYRGQNVLGANCWGQNVEGEVTRGQNAGDEISVNLGHARSICRWFPYSNMLRENLEITDTKSTFHALNMLLFLHL